MNYQDNNSAALRSIFIVAMIGVILAVCVIGLGAFTRLVDAGLGCPDWPGCYGHVLWPDTHEEIQAANQAYPHMPVLTDKTWPEMVHRYFASSLGLLIIVIVGLCWRKRQADAPLKLAVFSLGFIILQGMFGMWTVTLKLWPQIVTAHLLGGFTTFCLLAFIALRTSAWRYKIRLPQTVNRKGIVFLARVALFAGILQIFLGGWTTSNYAAVACPDFPQCQQQWLPELNIADAFDLAQHIGPNYLGGKMDNAARVTIHLSHRVGAIIVSIAVLLLVVALWRVSFMSKVLLAALLIQVALGISNIVFNFPVGIAVAHNLMGLMLLLALLITNYSLLERPKA